MNKLDKDAVLFLLRAIERQLSMGNGEEFEQGLSPNKFESTFVRYSFGEPKNKVETKIIMTKHDIE
jgi:hypothetical protein